MKLEQILSLIIALSQAMSKVVLPDIVMYARKTFVVAWSDIFQELVDLIYKAYDLSKVKSRVRAFAKATRARADYMLNHAWEFDGLTTAAEAAEHITVFALTKLGMIPADNDPQLLIRAAITTEKIKDIVSTRKEGDLVGGDHLLDALINAGTPTTIDGQDPIPPIINFAELLLDGSRALDRVIERARAWTRDPEWIAEMAILYAYWEVRDEKKPVAVPNGK
jgi:hypothetical protein